jgi:hypothetical protein
MKLAIVANEEEFVNADLVSHFQYIREDYGLAKLLLLIREYVQSKPVYKSNAKPQTPETIQPNQDPNDM